MQLKTICFAIICSMVTLQSSSAPLNNPPQELKPYLQVKPVQGEERNVRVFFSPACLFSKQYVGFFKNLSRTLPQGKRFLYTPLVNKKDGVQYALAFAAVQRFYPDFLQSFVEASMFFVQEHGGGTDSWVNINKIGRASKIPLALTELIAKHKEVLAEDVEMFVRLRKNLEITNTPSVAVVGTYVITPEFTAGDTEQFNQLVNAVISLSL